ncbi:hypothetical protein Leryth_005135 [Lithospermum erythrorhizon]|nr:hypothetical protein Leryth_005135 [Lithospermum erythrorhizon]
MSSYVISHENTSLFVVLINNININMLFLEKSPGLMGTGLIDGYLLPPLGYDDIDGIANVVNVISEPWWLSSPSLCEDLICDFPHFNSHSTSTTPTSTLSDDPIICDYHSPPSDSSKKQHLTSREIIKTEILETEGLQARLLLKPCASAINAGDLSRVQHFLCVLHEIASSTGDANCRLADHGLQALKYHLSSANSAPIASSGTHFASTNPRFFKNALLNFNDINPWFRIPNSIANSSILQILMEQDHQVNLHILDICVSHGVQWPTLIEELSSRPGGPPPSVRLTVVNPVRDNNQSGGTTPFETSPVGYSFSSQLLGFAKTKNINLQINILNNCPLQSLSPEIIKCSKGEALIAPQSETYIVFKMIETEFLKIIQSMEPKGVILSENNSDCSCINCTDFGTEFSRRLDYLWRFLDSTSVAYKGRDSEERRMMEVEAAKALTNIGEMNERKENWCNRIQEISITITKTGTSDPQ